MLRADEGEVQDVLGTADEGDDVVVVHCLDWHVIYAHDNVACLWLLGPANGAHVPTVIHAVDGVQEPPRLLCAVLWVVMVLLDGNGGNAQPKRPPFVASEEAFLQWRCHLPLVVLVVLVVREAQRAACLRPRLLITATRRVGFCRGRGKRRGEKGEGRGGMAAEASRGC